MHADLLSVIGFNFVYSYFIVLMLTYWDGLKQSCDNYIFRWTCWFWTIFKLRIWFIYMYLVLVNFHFGIIFFWSVLAYWQLNAYFLGKIILSEDFNYYIYSFLDTCNNNMKISEWQKLKMIIYFRLIFFIFKWHMAWDAFQFIVYQWSIYKVNCYHTILFLLIVI